MNLNKVLFSILIFIFVTIIIGTIYCFIQKKESIKVPETISPEINQNQKSYFTELGQLRLSTKPDKNDKSTIIILTPLIEYDSNNRIFYEELDTKKLQISQIISNYFTSKSINEIKQKNEHAIKSDLLASINSILALGKIEKIFFADFQFL
ncbi:MAG: hypothetical protein J6B63_04490 [Treponema sp.]|nr:hypothetical protein [Treponema sp.]MBP3607500.1 hypothetical protein [Treponema sp.]